MILQNFDNKRLGSAQRINQDSLEPAPKPDKGKHEQNHIQIGKLLKSFVYGGVDGSSNILIVITSGMSSALSIAVCISDGIVMGLGDYLSAKARTSFIDTEYKRQEYQVDNFLQKQKEQIIDFYQIQKYSYEDSKRISQLYSTNKQAFVDIMMLQELHLVADDPANAIKCGFATFFAFLLFGVLPILPFIVTSAIMKQETRPWIPSLCIGAVEFVSLGVLKATIIGSSKLKSALQIFIISSIATAVGYGVGFIFPS